MTPHPKKRRLYDLWSNLQSILAEKKSRAIRPTFSQNQNSSEATNQND